MTRPRRRWCSGVLLALLALGCAREPSGPARGGTLARGYGVTLRRVTYVPDDRVLSFGLVSRCEPADGSRCADRDWGGDELAAVANAARMLGQLSGFDTSYTERSPEVRVHALPARPPEPGCTDGAVTCWFGATHCAEGAAVLLDRGGAPLLDSYKGQSYTLTPCARWRIELSLDNLHAWSDFLGLERWRVLRAVVLHEMGHTLGLEHTSSGLMRGNLPVCYFIEPGHPRDKYDPAAPSDAFQRFECLEGVKPPELALAQRMKLDAYRPGGAGWTWLELK